uniref:Alsin Rho guanine nucleotide exchange factor ALS2 a n=1 Tax=Labrus bergylta TaxID=56723 RepID=A0A3Q3KU11_9LABR
MCVFFNVSPVEEQAQTLQERGILYIWQSAGPALQLCPERVLLSRPVLQAALGEHHGLLLTQGGLVYSFGELFWRDLSVPVTAPVLEVSLLGKTMVRVAAGGFHCGALSDQGNIYMWGENTAGQCVSEPCHVPVVDSEVIPPAVVKVVDLAFGREHSLALSAQNELWAWGSGCQLGLVTSTFPVWKPQKVEHLAGRHVLQVACGAYHSLALVRSLTPKNYNTLNPEKGEQGQSTQSFVTERDELLAADTSHYCPLGVELSGEVIISHHIMLNHGVKEECYWRYLKNGDAQSTHQDDSHPQCICVSDLKSYSSSSIPYSSSPVCLEEVRLFLAGEKQGLQGQKSSSLTNINQKGKAASRRRSLPGIPTRGRNGRAAAPEDAGDGLPSLETEVWSWGRGSEGQLGHGDQLARLQPLCVKSMIGEEVIKVAAGSHHSLALTAHCQVYSWGSNMCGQLGHVNSPVTVPQLTKLSDGLRVWDISAGQSHSLLLADGDCVQPVLLYCGQQLLSVQQEMSHKGQSVCCGGPSCAALADQNVMGFISAIHELASRERQFFCWLSNTRKLLLTPLRNRGQSFSNCVLIARHSTSLSYFLHNVQRQDVTSLLLLTHTEHFVDIYKDIKNEQLNHFSPLLPLLQLTVEYQSLHQGCSQYESLSLSLTRRKKEAEVTLLFWKSHPGKTTEVLRLPKRRVVCESSNRSLTLQNAGRFSNHWFMLFNDALVHTQVNKCRRPHYFFPTLPFFLKKCSLVISLSVSLCVCLSLPLFLYLSLSLQNKWLRSLNQAMDQVVGGGGQGSSPGLTAMSRTASYVFTGEGWFKDAQYTGAWLAGRVHGRGTMKWPDGRVYSGNFKNGQEDGFGHYIIPNKVLNKPDIYQGNWKDGKIHGFGKYKYASGEVYEGCFCEGQRHGYGMLNSGRLSKTSSGVFIGQWLHGKKTGYGVYDDITRGEKYMGLWLDEQRHGSAVVVTQYGVYFEGTFRENKMSGQGLLVSDDDTALHGEFSDDWTVNGKVE